MKVKFWGCCLMVVMCSIPILTSMSQESNAGLFDGTGLFGRRARAQNDCGSFGAQYGAQNCGAMGAFGYSAYNGCGGDMGGGGGPGLQFAPQAYFRYNVAPSYAPRYIQQACPGGMCTIDTVTGMEVARHLTVPAGIHLEPGVSYVHGSLREVQPTTEYVYQERKEYVTRPVQTASLERPVGLTESQKLENRKKVASKVAAVKGVKTVAMITTDSCSEPGKPCFNAKGEIEASGVEVEIVNANENPGKAIEYWQDGKRKDGSKLEFATPAYVLFKDGVIIDRITGLLEGDDVRAAVGLEPLGRGRNIQLAENESFIEEPPAEEVTAAPAYEEPTEEEGDVVAALLSIAEEMKAQREAEKEAIAARKARELEVAAGVRQLASRLKN